MQQTATKSEPALPGLKRIRGEKGLTLRDVSAMSGVSLGVVHYCERGGHKPHRSTVAAIARALDTTPEALRGEVR